MIHDFLEYIQKNNLVEENDKILLAVSGGVDSMVMLDLFKDRFDIVVGHINHDKRGDESENDRLFIQEYCASINIRFESIKIKSIDLDTKNNFQNEARIFRYDWLNQIAKKYNCNKIATAHHESDSLETFIGHFMRGSSLTGLTGIEHRNPLIRPLLFSSKQQIEDYAELNGIHFREDSSNMQLTYNRNIVRHEVIPALLKIHPNNFNGFQKTLHNLKDNKALFQSLLKGVYKNFVTEKKHWTEVRLAELKSMDHFTSILYQYLQKFGFNKEASDASLNLKEGQYLYSNEFQITKHKEVLLIGKRIRQEKRFELNILNDTNIACSNYGTMTATIHQSPKFSCENNVESIPQKMWRGKKTIRLVTSEDMFQPIGMNGQQKNIMKFLRDEGINPFQRMRTLVLEIEGIICWVIGHRLDERFKITNQSDSAFQLKWNNIDD